MMTMAAGASSRPSSSPGRGISGRIERGASSVEYGLLIVGIAALVVLVIVALGGSVFGLFDDSCSSIAAQRGTRC